MWLVAPFVKKKKKRADEHDRKTALKNKLAEISLYGRTGYENNRSK